MSTSSPSVVVAARIAPQHAEQLRQLADQHASTVSRQVARIIDVALARDNRHEPDQD